MSPFPHVLVELCHSHMKRGSLIPLRESEWVWDSDETSRIVAEVTLSDFQGQVRKEDTTSTLITGTLVMEP